MSASFACLPVLLVLFTAWPSAQGAADLGDITFPNSGAAEAQPAFLEGALLLHSFEYEDAAEAFRRAQELDPDFALAYWGEALTNAHLLWRRHDVDAARAVLARLAPTPEERAAACPTERERGFLRACEALFPEGGSEDDMGARVLAYSRLMGELYERYPDDHEVAAFYAISILPTSGKGRDTRVYMRAAGIAEQVYRDNPRHPGALHYLIHSYDDPVHAPLGLRQAFTYAKVAPAASHALHMPSHIFVALGMWDESAASNVDASAAADARRARKELDIEARGYHSLWWLAYTYHQLGRREEAAQLLRDMVRDEAESHSKRTRFHLVAMRAAHVVEAELFEDEFAELELDPAELRLMTYATERFIRGRIAYERRDLEELEAQTAAICAERLARVDGDPPDVERGCCLPVASGTGYDANDPSMLGTRALELELYGMAALLKQDLEAADGFLRSATEVEDEVAYDFGPPHVVKPAHELYGEFLLMAGRPHEAMTEFGQALDRAPRRARSLLGLARAQDLAGEAEASRATYTELLDMWKHADADLHELVEVRAGAAER